ncbi:hypothetical protein B0H13DRAFT_1892846 [Mycena leptocephala]|nr:hypothetical protein B0H13DRAFT_1892846 [Mycena leptocephala]
MFDLTINFMGSTCREIRRNPTSEASVGMGYIWARCQLLSSLLYVPAWDEWASGINGFLAVRDLEEHWGPRRRRDVIQFVERLSKKKNWNVALALKFIRETYDGKLSPQKFCEINLIGSLVRVVLLIQTSTYAESRVQLISGQKLHNAARKRDFEKLMQGLGYDWRA